jgi:2-methylcitrate dehydratase PrpD
MSAIDEVATVTATERIARYITGLRFEDLPREVVTKAKEHVAYHVAHALRGYRREDGRRGITIARMLSEGAGAGSIIGSDVRVPPLDAAFANSSLMRAWEMDDVVFPAGVHAALVTLPPAMALAERHHRSGADLLVALVVGYDVIAAIAMDIEAWGAREPRRPTIPFGPFGGAAAASRILGLDAAATASALGYAAHSAMGLAEEGGEWPHYYALVARNGMMAATIAQAGAMTSRTILEGQYGFYEAFFGKVPPGLDASLERLGERHAMLEATTKRYPGTGANIVAVELTREMVRELGVSPERVARIDLTLPNERENFTIGHVRGPFRTWRAASSVLFQVAIVIIDGGRTDFARYEEPNAPEILELTERIHFSFEPGHGFQFARVRITLTDGAVLEREAERHRFPPIDTVAEISDAGRDLLPAPKLARAAELIATLESVDDVAVLMETLRS